MVEKTNQDEEEDVGVQGEELLGDPNTYY
jgi:methyltransferase-like protein 6